MVLFGLSTLPWDCPRTFGHAECLMHFWTLGVFRTLPSNYKLWRSNILLRALRLNARGAACVP
ncbi:hypothetical protein SAMN05216525_11756 [Bradyrhizobium sp. Gha]|nr:hypothetical protein SAMN05216525_11756 [Bradyrhizobium sp. Gha]